MNICRSSCGSDIQSRLCGSDRRYRWHQRSAILLLSCALWSGARAEFAERIFIGDHILTMGDSQPAAVAIGGGRILWVGQRAGVDAWRGPDTQLEHLGERALMPGFIDAHGHLSFLAQTVDMANVSAPPVGAADTIAALQNVLRTYIKQRTVATGGWVVGMGYDDSLLAERRHPTRGDLDAVDASRPIVLIHVSGHLMTANSRALQLTGINAETPDPPGGHIRRMPDSREPNGVLEELATAPLRARIESLVVDPGAAIEKALDVYASYGITTVQDGATSPAQLATLRTLDAAGRLDLDVTAYPIGMDPDAPLPISDTPDSSDRRLRVAGVKLILDGSPQGKTAYLSTPYLIPPASADPNYRGYPLLPPAMVNALVARYLSAHLQVLAHANGDAAAQLLIDAVAKAAPRFDHRTVMIHAQTVREDQLDRMAALGILPSYFAAHTFYWGDWHRDSVLGPERAARISPLRSTLDRGMHFTVHNDAPIVPPDMIRLLWACTNRQTRSGAVLGPGQRIATLEALRAMTRDAAYQQFEEASKGSIAPGKRADLVILDRDPLILDPTDLLRVQIDETISRGNIVYRRQANPASD